MPYTAYDDDKPDQATQTGVTFGNSTKANLLALRDMIVAFGVVPGWNMSLTGADPALPDTIVFSRTVDAVSTKVRVSNQWGTGRLNKCKFEYSINGGSSYDNIVDTDGNYVLTFGYDGNGNLTTTSWGTTW